MVDQKITLKDIAGYPEEKEEAKKIIEVLKNHEKYEKIGAYVPRGLILSGREGIGKTMIAKAIACESNVPFYELETDESDENETIKSIKALFAKARDDAPSIIFIDELDDLISTNDYSSDYSRKLLKALLTEIDGIRNSEGVMVIATTNYRFKLPKPLIRSGRMDKRIEMEMPNVQSREEIFKLYLDRHESLKHISPKKLASKTVEFNGADIKTLINEVIIDCASKGVEKIEMKDFERIIPTIRFQNIARKDPEGVEPTTIYHEVGHWVVGYIATGQIGSISTERYGGVDGHVSFDENPKGDANPGIRRVSLKNLDSNLQISVAGMAGEEVFTGDKTIGALEDVLGARKMIRSLATAGVFGFDYTDPNVQVESRRFVTIETSQSQLMRLENLESDLLTKAYDKAKEILESHRELAELVASELKERKRLSKDDMEELIENYISAK